MAAVEAETVIRRNPRVVFRSLEDGTGVLLHLDSTAYHGVNGVGALIWSLLDASPTFGALIGKVRSRLTDPPTNLDEDVAEFISDLKTRDLVRFGKENEP
jgi:hypothetical protein